MKRPYATPSSIVQTITSAWLPALLASSLEVLPAAAGAPALEPGFPVRTSHTGGSYHAGQALHTLVANIDADPQLEILATSTATGPVYAWNHDGSLVSGWPVTAFGGVGYLSAGNLSGAADRLEVFIGYWGSEQFVAFDGSGAVLPGWPRPAANFTSTPPALGDINADGIDEIFTNEEDFAIRGYFADGRSVPGSPFYYSDSGQERHTPALADLDGDGTLEVISAGGWTSSVRGIGITLFAFRSSGGSLPGFPKFIPTGGLADAFPAVGDVDGDGTMEIVIATKQAASPFNGVLHVISPAGVTVRQLVASRGLSFSSAPALADLTNDDIPELLLLCEGGLFIWRGDGTPLPGWPQTWSTSEWLGNSAPVVGDLDGDAQLEIAFTTQVAGSSASGFVRVYNADGTPEAGFPLPLPIGSGAVPAIADVDADGRNELIVTGTYWNGMSGSFDKVWVYDFGGGDHGPIEWGQFGGNARHDGWYKPRLRGDTNCDGVVNFDDLDSFVLAILGEPGYLAALPRCNFINADANRDGEVDFDDISGFVALIIGG